MRSRSHRHGLMAFLATGPLAAVGLGTMGCSLIVSQPPPVDRPMRSETECRDATWPVYADGYLALNTGALAVVFLGAAAIAQSTAGSEVEPSWKPHSMATQDVRTLGAIGLVATAATVGLIQSARYGSRSARECEFARSQVQQGQYDMPANPGPLPQTPAPVGQTTSQSP